MKNYALKMIFPHTHMKNYELNMIFPHTHTNLQTFVFHLINHTNTNLHTHMYRQTYKPLVST
jgi:hypothetical protein